MTLVPVFDIFVYNLQMTEFPTQLANTQVAVHRRERA